MSLRPTAGVISYGEALLWAMRLRELSLGNAGYLHRLSRKQQRPWAELRDEQWAKVRRMVEHAYAHTTYYRRLFDTSGIDPHRVETAEDFARLPLLTRDVLRNQGEELLDRRLAHAQLIAADSSGTTDTPVRVYTDRASLERKWGAALVVRRQFAQWRPLDRICYLWGARQDLTFHSTSVLRRLLKEPVLRTLELYSSHLTPERLSQYAAELVRFRPSVILAYPTPMYLLAEHIAAHKLKTSAPRIITTTAEPLYDYQRERIQEVFGCPVIDQYGAREGGLIASECLHRKGLHINTETVLVEIVDTTTNCPVPPGTLGKVLITDLQNLAMPLIRYEMRDLAILSTRTCACGSPLPLLERLEGRLADVFQLADGTLVPGVSLNGRIYTSGWGIKAVQVIQDDYSRFRVLLVKDETCTDEHLRQLDERFRGYFGDVEVTYVPVERIEPEPSGKVRFCISHVPWRGVGAPQPIPQASGAQ